MAVGRQGAALRTTISVRERTSENVAAIDASRARQGASNSKPVVPVDDEPNIRETVAFILEAKGSKWGTGSDGDEAWKAARRRS
jgi:hypothetical protein